LTGTDRSNVISEFCDYYVQKFVEFLRAERKKIVKIARQIEEEAEEVALAASKPTNASTPHEHYGGAIRDQAVNLFPLYS
jgi:hypothetical protein